MQYDRATWQKEKAAYVAKVVAKNNNKPKFDEDKIYEVMYFIKSKILDGVNPPDGAVGQERKMSSFAKVMQ